MLSSVLTDPALHIHRHPQRTSPVSSGTVWEGDQLVFNVCQCEKPKSGFAEQFDRPCYLGHHPFLSLDLLWAPRPAFDVSFEVSWLGFEETQEGFCRK